MFSYVLKKWSCYISDTAVTYFLAKYIGEGKKKKTTVSEYYTLQRLAKNTGRLRKVAQIV